MTIAAVLDFSRPHLLRTAREHRAAVREIDALLDARRAARDDDRLAFLSLLVADYEERHEVLEDRDPTPQEAVMFMLEQRGMRRADLVPLMGGKARVSEFFSGRRRLSMGQVRALRDALGIPADLLIS